MDKVMITHPQVAVAAWVSPCAVPIHLKSGWFVAPAPDATAAVITAGGVATGSEGGQSSVTASGRTTITDDDSEDTA